MGEQHCRRISGNGLYCPAICNLNRRYTNKNEYENINIIKEKKAISKINKFKEVSTDSQNNNDTRHIQNNNAINFSFNMSQCSNINLQNKRT